MEIPVFTSAFQQSQCILKSTLTIVKVMQKQQEYKFFKTVSDVLATYGQHKTS